MCPCTVRGSTFRDLSPEVATEVTRFFKMCLNKLKAESLSANRAAGLLSTITGAMVVANALSAPGEAGAFQPVKIRWG